MSLYQSISIDIDLHHHIFNMLVVIEITPQRESTVLGNNCTVISENLEILIYKGTSTGMFSVCCTAETRIYFKRQSTIIKLKQQSILFFFLFKFFYVLHKRIKRNVRHVTAIFGQARFFHRRSRILPQLSGQNPDSCTATNYQQRSRHEKEKKQNIISCSETQFHWHVQAKFFFFFFSS